MIEEIFDFNKPELRVYSDLSEVELRRMYEPNGGIFIAETLLVIERALEAGCKPLSFLVDKSELKGDIQRLLELHSDVPIYCGENSLLSKLTGFKLTRGILCAMERPAMKNVHEICSGSSRIAVLENVMNPTNVGAIFRSAAALGIDAVLLTAGCSDPLYRRALRVGMGNAFLINWSYLPEDYVSFLRDEGYVTAAMALSDASISICDERLKEAGKLALILGNEGEGLLQQTIADCDYTVRIPMAAGVDSLNVAAASAVAFWEVTRLPK